MGASGRTVFVPYLNDVANCTMLETVCFVRDNCHSITFIKC